MYGIAQVAYVPQSAFIYNATVRENILFGQPYNEARYQTALNAASLAPDLAILPGAPLLESSTPHTAQLLMSWKKYGWTCVAPIRGITNLLGASHANF